MPIIVQFLKYYNIIPHSLARQKENPFHIPPFSPTHSENTPFYLGLVHSLAIQKLSSRSVEFDKSFPSPLAQAHTNSSRLFAYNRRILSLPMNIEFESHDAWSFP